MKSVLIISAGEKSLSVLTDLLSRSNFSEIIIAKNGGEARRQLDSRGFDLCIVNAPLPDESGNALACEAARRDICQVILIVRSEQYDEAAAHVENDGVFTIEKPINRGLFWNALKLAEAAHSKMTALHKKNDKLQQAIEDIALINRAKCLLIERLHMSEDQAHKYIEKQAMDMRSTRLAIATNILRTYES